MLLRQQAIFILPLIAALSTTIQCKQSDRIRLRGNFGDKFTSGTMLNNLFKREIHRAEEAVEPRIRQNGFYADRFTSGTSLNNLFKRSLNDDAHEQTIMKNGKTFLVHFSSICFTDESVNSSTKQKSRILVLKKYNMLLAIVKV